MLGWRLRVGILTPTNNTVIEPEYYQRTLPGVTFHTTRMISSRTGHASVDGLKNLVTNVDRAVEEFSIAGVDVMMYACLSTSLVHEDWEEQFATKVARWSKVPNITAFAAAADGLKELGCSRPAILCPYGPQMQEMVIPSFGRLGISPTTVHGLNVTGLQAVCNLEPGTVYRAALAVDRTGADSLCILATDIRTLDIAQQLEEDLGIPVVTTNQALLWRSLRLGGVAEGIPNTGSLLLR